MRYTEHEKLHKVEDQSQAIGEFLDWLEYEKGLFLCEYVDCRDSPVRGHTPVEKLLAEFFKINLNRLEKEKRHMLDEQRKPND